MSQLHLWQEDSVTVDHFIRVSVTLDYGNGTRKRLWYQIASDYGPWLTPSCDPFVVATILMAMHHASDIVVHGSVSPSLLQNLAEFQVAWACWRPEQYHPITIIPEIEQEQPSGEPEQRAIAAFSGGVDSCFTLFRHCTGTCGRVQRPITAGLMVHGFDIPLSQNQEFNRAAAKSQAIVDSLGVKLILMSSNYRKVIPLNWEDSYGVAIASCLMLLQGGYTVGLLGSAFPYQNLMLPRGSNPVTDPFLANQRFQIVHDGAGFHRLQKIQAIAAWSEALDHLRVCWQGAQLDRNCGRCEKCIRTILGFRVIGCDLPKSFEQDVSDQQIRQLKQVRPLQLAELTLILQEAKARGIRDSWVNALETCIIRNQRQLALKRLFKQRLPVPLQTAIQHLRRR